MNSFQEWEELGFALASKTRTEIILDLVNGAKTPKEISQKLAIYMSHVSLALATLRKRGLVICLTPKLRRGKLYGLTESGLRVAKKLKTRTNNARE